jgi:translocation and assembly module TamA
MYHKIVTIILLSSTLLLSDTNTTIDDNSSSKYALFDSGQKIVLPSHQIECRFVGDHHLQESDIQIALGVDVKSSYEFWKDYNPTIKDKLIPTLAESMRSFLDSEGYYDATYDIKVSKDRVAITIKEGKPTTIYDINITSDYEISKIVDFQKGEVFAAKKFIAIKQNIINGLLKDGYCSYELDSKAYVDLDKHRVDLRYILKKGGVCRFGKVSIKGSDSVDDRVITSRIRAREGKRFSTERIQESYDALYALDAFDVVGIKYDRKFYNVVPIDVEVSDITKPWYFMGGIGFDTNVGARVQSEIIRKNFMGDAKKLRLRLQYSRLEQLAEVTLFTPALLTLFDYSIDSFMKFGYSNLEYTGFMEEKLYATGSFAYINEVLELKMGFTMEDLTISLLDDYDEGKLTQAISTGDFFLAYPFISFIYDKRDSKLNPKYGYYVAGMLEYGIPYDEDASGYIKYQIEGRAIYSIDRLTLAAVAKMGILEEKENEVPESKKFFAGGVYSNRAYGYNRMGVIITPTRYGIDGALTMANLSLEADYPLVGDIYGAIFNDNTMLTINSYDFTGDIISSAGFGMRYMTPIGPIKLDVGMNVRDPSQYGLQFQIGQSF